MRKNNKVKILNDIFSILLGFLQRLGGFLISHRFRVWLRFVSAVALVVEAGAFSVESHVLVAAVVAHLIPEKNLKSGS